MHLEIERKFLVKDDSFKADAVEKHGIRQGYIAHDSGRSVRVRIRDGQGILTVKGPHLDEASRPEWEKELTQEEAEDLFLLCKPGAVEKTRWIVPAEMPDQVGHDGNPEVGHDDGSVMAGSDRPSRFFEVDEFHGENEGLVLAEIELGSPDEPFERPSWLGTEVTGDKRYYNAHLTRQPYKTW